MGVQTDERTGNILMKKVFSKPANLEELYKFFTYGLPLTPLNYRYRWSVNATHNSIKRRVWYVRTSLYADSVIVDYQPRVKESDDSWYMYEWKWDVSNKCT